jgi:predicted flap endonuclease-1-like 5' DNA nuclease
MDFSFNAENLRSILKNIVQEHFQDMPLKADDEKSPARLIEAMEKAIDVMERADADAQAKAKAKTEAHARTQALISSENDATQIGDYALTLIEGIADHIRTDVDQQGFQTFNRDLMYLAVVVASWIATHKGKIDKIEMVVNAFAGYANHLRDAAELAELCPIIRNIINVVSDDIRKDLEQTNLMRPWRILNLNYGIVATRSHDLKLIEQAYDTLVENLPQDAREFFREGMKQMDIVGYPQEVRAVVEKYDRMWGADSTLH